MKSIINIITKLPPTNYVKTGVEINVNLSSSLTCRNCKWNRCHRGLICFAARRQMSDEELADPIRPGTCWHESCAKYSTRAAIRVVPARQLIPLSTVVADSSWRGCNSHWPSELQVESQGRTDIDLGKSQDAHKTYKQIYTLSGIGTQHACKGRRRANEG